MITVEDLESLDMQGYKLCFIKKSAQGVAIPFSEEIKHSFVDKIYYKDTLTSVGHAIVHEDTIAIDLDTKKGCFIDERKERPTSEEQANAFEDFFKLSEATIIKTRSGGRHYLYTKTHDIHDMKELSVVVKDMRLVFDIQAGYEDKELKKRKGGLSYLILPEGVSGEYTILKEGTIDAEVSECFVNFITEEKERRANKKKDVGCSQYKNSTSFLPKIETIKKMLALLAVSFCDFKSFEKDLQAFVRKNDDNNITYTRSSFWSRVYAPLKKTYLNFDGATIDFLITYFFNNLPKGYSKEITYAKLNSYKSAKKEKMERELGIGSFIQYFKACEDKIDSKYFQLIMTELEDNKEQTSNQYVDYFSDAVIELKKNDNEEKEINLADSLDKEGEESFYKVIKELQKHIDEVAKDLLNLLKKEFPKQKAIDYFMDLYEIEVAKKRLMKIQEEDDHMKHYEMFLSMLFCFSASTGCTYRTHINDVYKNESTDMYLMFFDQSSGGKGTLHRFIESFLSGMYTNIIAGVSNTPTPTSGQFILDHAASLENRSMVICDAECSQAQIMEVLNNPKTTDRGLKMLSTLLTDSYGQSRLGGKGSLKGARSQDIDLTSINYIGMTQPYHLVSTSQLNTGLFGRFVFAFPTALSGGIYKEYEIEQADSFVKSEDDIKTQIDLRNSAIDELKKSVTPKKASFITSEDQREREYKRTYIQRLLLDVSLGIKNGNEYTRALTNPKIKASNSMLDYFENNVTSYEEEDFSSKVHFSEVEFFEFCLGELEFYEKKRKDHESSLKENDKEKQKTVKKPTKEELKEKFKMKCQNPRYQVDLQKKYKQDFTLQIDIDLVDFEKKITKNSLYINEEQQRLMHKAYYALASLAIVLAKEEDPSATHKKISPDFFITCICFFLENNKLYFDIAKRLEGKIKPKGDTFTEIEEKNTALFEDRIYNYLRAATKELLESLKDSATKATRKLVISDIIAKAKIPRNKRLSAVLEHIEMKMSELKNDLSKKDIFLDGYWSKAPGRESAKKYSSSDYLFLKVQTLKSKTTG